MEKLNEILIDSLSVSKPAERIDFLVDLINKSINPPRKAAADNVNIRVMFIVNDRVNSHGGRFRRSDLEVLSRLIVDTPVLIGHNRAGAPLARNFHAELESKGDAVWLKCYFYWPRVPDGETDKLLEKIDSGVLKECSISFTYTFPECSECGQDIRNCSHNIDLNNIHNRDSATHFIYGGISEVLETSLVYKGSVKGTYLSDKLSSLPGPEIALNIGGKRREISLPRWSVSALRISIVDLGLAEADPAEILSKSPDLAACLGFRRGNAYLLAKQV